jgi:hypothetical protein
VSVAVVAGRAVLAMALIFVLGLVMPFFGHEFPPFVRSPRRRTATQVPKNRH